VCPAVRHGGSTPTSEEPRDLCLRLLKGGPDRHLRTCHAGPGTRHRVCLRGPRRERCSGVHTSEGVERVTCHVTQGRGAGLDSRRGLEGLRYRRVRGKPHSSPPARLRRLGVGDRSDGWAVGPTVFLKVRSRSSRGAGLPSRSRAATPQGQPSVPARGVPPAARRGGPQSNRWTGCSEHRMCGRSPLCRFLNLGRWAPLDPFRALEERARATPRGVLRGAQEWSACPHSGLHGTVAARPATQWHSTSLRGWNASRDWFSAS